MSDQFVKLGNFSTLETGIVKAILEEAGIISYILGEESLTNSIGVGSAAGVEIRVPEDKLEEARQILAEAKDSD